MIHPTAIVHKTVKIGDNVRIGPHVRIEEGVTIGDGTEVMDGTIIFSNTIIGKNNQIFPYCIIGGLPQDKKYAGEPSLTVIGDNNIIREFTTIHKPVGEKVILPTTVLLAQTQSLLIMQPLEDMQRLETLRT